MTLGGLGGAGAAPGGGANSPEVQKLIEQLRQQGKLPPATPPPGKPQ
jgi:hypothetical protein